MRQIEILIGTKFGEWTFLSNAPTRKGQTMAFCVCSCGTFAVVHVAHMLRGKTTKCKRCGNFKHGKCFTRTYTTWQSMLHRCLDEKNKNYKRYGLRGIKVCEEWKVFNNFLEDMGERPPGKSLDRIDNDGDYCKENCRWATSKVQSNNMSNNRIIKFKGKDYTCSQLAEHLGMDYHALWSRIKAGTKLDAPVKLFKKKQK